MTSKTERMASDLSHTGSTFQRDTVTTANGEACAIPTEWLGRFVELTALGADVFIRFGASNGVQVDQATASARGADPFPLTATTKGPHVVIPAGQSRHERVDSSWTHFAHIASATGGKLYAVLATGDGE